MEIMWAYLGKDVSDISDFPKDCIGFIYCVTTTDGKRYIGKKSLYSNKKRHFGKRELAKMKDKRLKTYEIIKKESNWKTYNGSSKLIKYLPEGISVCKKEILDFAFTPKQLTYLETKYLFNYGVLESDDYYNGNILGKFFKGDTSPK